MIKYQAKRYKSVAVKAFAIRNLGESPDFSTAYEYDLRGNIISLSRHGVVDRVPFGLKGTMDSYGLLDDLSISYDGNMISSVHSAGTKAATFAGRAGAALREGDYDLRWDEAARLKYDETRSIVDISYNSLGQPASMLHSCDDLQTYTYDGLGRRTETNYHTARNSTDHRRRYHASGLVTCNDTIETLRFPGGYFDRALQAHYYVTDYQGNNIAVLPHQFEARPEQSMSYYPYGEPHRRPTASGSPSASTQNRYLFADKEYTDFGGESHSDFGPRTLNLPIPFFATQDKHSDDYHGTSPYVFCGGNPVMFTDPTGNDTIYVYINNQFRSIGFVNDEHRYLVKGKAEKAVRNGDTSNLANNKDVAILPSNEDLRTIIDSMAEANEKGVEVGGHKEKGGEIVRWDDGGKELNYRYGRFYQPAKSIAPLIVNGKQAKLDPRNLEFYWHVHPGSQYDSSVGRSLTSTTDEQFDGKMRDSNGYSGTTMLVGGGTKYIRFYYKKSDIRTVTIKSVLDLINR